MIADEFDRERPIRRKASKKAFLLIFFLNLFFIPSFVLASTGGLGDIYLGYLSIYVLIPILVLLPTIRFLYLAIRKSINKKLAYLSLIVSTVSLLILFILATQYFSFDFKYLHRNERWESLFLLVLPTYISWFLFRKKNNTNTD